MEDGGVGGGCPLGWVPVVPARCHGPTRGFAAPPSPTAGSRGEAAAPEQVLWGWTPPPALLVPAPAGHRQSPVLRGQGAAGGLIADGGAMTPRAAPDPTFTS